MSKKSPAYGFTYEEYVYRVWWFYEVGIHPKVIAGIFGRKLSTVQHLTRKSKFIVHENESYKVWRDRVNNIVKPHPKREKAQKPKTYKDYLAEAVKRDIDYRNAPKAKHWSVIARGQKSVKR